MSDFLWQNMVGNPSGFIGILVNLNKNQNFLVDNLTKR